MMKPNAKEMPRRSASVTAGVALPASVSVAMTEPGPTRTNAAVPKASAAPLCVNEYMAPTLLCDWDPIMPNTFPDRTPGECSCQAARAMPPIPAALSEGAGQVPAQGLHCEGAREEARTTPGQPRQRRASWFSLG